MGFRIVARVPSAIIFGLALALLIGSTSSGHSEQKASFNYGDIHEVYLSLQSMASLPNNVIFLGGSYRTSANPVHSCILVSRNAGKNWANTPVEFGEATVAKFQTYGKNMVWALIVDSKEGSESPEYLVVSRNAGMSWETVSLSFAGPPGPLLSVDDFRFIDASHGVLSTRNSLGHGRTYQTSNAGKSWKQIWDTTIDPNFGFFQYPAEAEPLHASLWTQDRSDATGLIRVLLDETQSKKGMIGPYSIQHMATPSNTPGASSSPHVNWENVAEIPYNYAIENGVLRPLSPISRN